MGILQTAYRTYENHSDLAGINKEGQREALTPIYHMLQNADIEITIGDQGNFIRADLLEKNDRKAIIPCTIESANRTSSPQPHPLCDNLQYLNSENGARYEDYLAKLSAWANSEFSHPKVAAVHRYIMNKTIIDDLIGAKIDISKADASKYFIIWRVEPSPEGIASQTRWDKTLFKCYEAYYESICKTKERDICMVSGEHDMVCETHAKGVVPINGNAKLLSANDSSGFTYRGRFTEANQAYNVGYLASQKAHNALRWIVANQGVMIGGRTFICWNPNGRPVPKESIFGLPFEENLDYALYKKQLFQTISGLKNMLKETDDVVIAALDAATTGRLAITYYNELKASDFYERIENWYNSFLWNSGYKGMISPKIRDIVACAFGTQRGSFIEADDRVLREHVQRMLRCIIDMQPIPEDIVRALVTKASVPSAYNKNNYTLLLVTACAAVRKSRNNKLKREEWKLMLDASNEDRSYLFGRLLAIAERVENSTYDRSEDRDTNAIRMQTVFSQRPMYAWRIIEEKLTPYFARLTPGLRAYFKNEVAGIADKLPAQDHTLNNRLEDTYLLGYYHQRSEFYKKKEIKSEEENNEYTEK